MHCVVVFSIVEQMTRWIGSRAEATNKPRAERHAQFEAREYDLSSLFPFMSANFKCVYSTTS